MALEFTSEHVVGVIVFVLVLTCCKSILECIQASLTLFKDCSCICDYNCGYDLCLYGKTFLYVFNTVQPVIMCLVGAIRAALTGYHPRSRVFVVALSLNTTSFLAQESTQVVATHLSFQSVDLLFTAIPFSLLACLSTFAWINLAKANLFDSDPVWEEDLFQHDERIWRYEILYYAELFGMCVALLAAASVPQLTATLLYMSTSVTALLVVFTCAARYPNHSQVGLFITSTTFALLCVMLATFAFTAVDTACGWAVLCGATFVCAVIGIAIFHHIAAGSLHAGTIIFVRTVFSNTCSVVLIATLAAGRTSSCSGENT